MEDSYYNHITSYLPELNAIKQYLPEPIQEKLDHLTNEENENVEKVQVLKMDTFRNNPILSIGYSNGFQLWSLKHPFHEIFSFRGENVHLLSKTIRNEYIAFVSKDALQTVVIFDLVKNKSLTSLAQEMEILELNTNGQLLLLVFQTLMKVYDTNFKFIRSIETRPQMQLNEELTYNVVFDLNAHWLCYLPSGKSSQPSVSSPLRQKKELVHVENATNVTSVSELMYSVANSIYQFSASKQESFENSICIEDISSGQRICTIESSIGEKEPVAFLKFNPTGLLLLVAGASGQMLHLHRLFPDGRNTPHRIVYTLRRGVTPAIIMDACFSPYSQFLAITTARGTTHFYAIHPDGGDFDIEPFTTSNATASPNSQPSNVIRKYLEVRDRSCMQTMDAIVRIRQCFPSPYKNHQLVVKPVIALQFIDDTIYIASWGSLTSHTLKTSIKRVLPSTNKYQVRLTFRNQRCWDMRRKSDWKTVQELPTLFMKSPFRPTPALETHHRPSVPIYLHPSVTFNTYNADYSYTAIPVRRSKRYSTNDPDSLLESKNAIPAVSSIPLSGIHTEVSIIQFQCRFHHKRSRIEYYIFLDQTWYPNN